MNKEKCQGCEATDLCMSISRPTINDFTLEDFQLLAKNYKTVSEMELNKKKSLQIIKTREVKTPNRGTSKSAGIDFYIPEDFKKTNLAPLERILIPSGIKMIIPDGYALIMHNKSGVATKKGLDVLANTIDSDYLGEVHISLVNNGTSIQTLEAGDKIIQGILLPVNYADVTEITHDEFNLYSTERGSGGFGSTGTK